MHAWAGSFREASGQTIELENAASLAGEIGTRLGAQVQSADLYLDLGVRHEFLGETEAEVSGLSFTQELPGTVAVAATGVAISALDDLLSIEVEASYAKGPEAEELSGTAAAVLKF